MDLFVLGQLSDNSLTMQNGALIEGRFNKIWVERYRDPGEFKLVAKMSDGLLDQIAEGMMISHTNTQDIMLVENVIIKEAKGKETTVEISGRSLDVIMETRIVGGRLNNANIGEIPPYTVVAAATWLQIQTMIAAHMTTGVINAGDTIPGLTITTGVTISEPVTVERVINRGTVHERVLELLKISDLGIRVLRPSYLNYDTTFKIHNGVDRIQSVVFSWDVGDLEDAEYLSSIKPVRNSAFVTGNEVYSVIRNGTGLNRRFMHVEARDIDDGIDPPFSTGVYNDLVAKLNVRGNTALAGRKQLSISSVAVSPTNRFRYRTDYNIGDIVGVDGNYDASQAMRVVEYAEIEDDTGERGYPTLSALET